ncbi:hypothetical protein FRC04_002326 [Tulasnella sp. 424]|nr:hypothetical protein FRC04_002326 [Tulasnella sp. 424]KAG8977399.1 hypothetical protein FRC05_001797 [Tulasnella sp. 425]
MLSKAVIALAILAGSASACTSTNYGQCGGSGYTGCTDCPSGYTCTYSSQWYSQCMPGTGTGTTTTTTSKSSTTTTTTKTSTTTTTTTTSSTPTYSAVTGYVKTSGQKFTVNGGTYFLVGENAWWMFTLASQADMDKAFADIAATGATTVRTWGFNEVVGSCPSGNTVCFQTWSGSTPTIQTSALTKFDQIVASAKSHGLRLIVPLTNNWSDFGGMDVYVKQILNSNNHDYFYSNTQVVTAYKNYVNTFVTRYKNEPGILAWELANEPRCVGSTGTTSGSCTKATITSWITTMSAYIKSIDTNHLVAIGDEGFGLSGGDSNPAYSNTPAGLDFATNLAISTVDFGTLHLYPIPWSASDSTNWGNTWITNHAAIQKSVGKPTILEEYGVTGTTSSQVSVYTSWLSTVVSSGMTGSLIWQAGSNSLPSGQTTPSQDGYGVYPGDGVYSLITSHNAAIKARG